MKIRILEVQQPIGSFYLSVLPASFIVFHTKRAEREYDPDGLKASGIQRRLDSKRIRDIETYTLDPEATFPTPIILSISSSDFDFTISNQEIQFNEDNFIAEIVDGQRRIEGLKRSSKVDDFQLPVVFLFDLTEQEKAYVFSTVNSNQQKVSPSLIYELFSVSDGRSPFKTAHDIARALNTDRESPYCGRLKMLGRKTGDNETLSQGTFVNSLLPLISSHPKEDLVSEKNRERLIDDQALPFRYSYIHGDDKFIYRVLLNYFKAIADTFRVEWEDPSKYIISKSTGCGGLMLALKGIALNGISRKSLDYEYFLGYAHQAKSRLEDEGKSLTSEFFASNNQGQNSLSRLFYDPLS